MGKNFHWIQQIQTISPWIKFRKYLHFFRKSENSDHSFNMVVYEKIFFNFFEKFF